MSDEQYTDPSTETVQRVAQAALPLATLADVAARLAADRRDEQDARDRRRLVDLHRRRAADQAAVAAVYRPALNARWLAGAGLADLGAAWRAAHANADIDPRAADAAARVELRLRYLHPPAMRHYDRLRGEGLTPAAAMAEAAHLMAFVDPNAHAKPPGPARPALDAMVSPEVAAGHAAAAAYTPGLNPVWLRHASVFELGQVWQAAQRHVRVDSRAATAAEHVEQQLRRLHPPAMRRYDDLRRAGRSPGDAMREAVRYIAGVDPTARPGDPGPRRPVLATDAHPARADADALTVPAGQDRQAAAATAGTRANPATTDVHEHTAAIPTERVLIVRAESGDPTAVLRSQMFPRPIRAELAAAPTRQALQLSTPPASNRPPTPTRGQ